MTFARDRAQWLEQQAARKERNMEALLAPSRSLHRGSYAADMGNPVSVPKSEPYRDAALLEMARDQPCMLLVPGVCNHRTDTTVAAHSNLSIHGKAGARKADDCYSVWGCAACHFWLDFGKAASAQKDMAFQLAHARQVLAWRLIAMDPNEPERFRRAARRALERLGVTTGETA